MVDQIKAQIGANQIGANQIGDSDNLIEDHIGANQIDNQIALSDNSFKAIDDIERSEVSTVTDTSSEKTLNDKARELSVRIAAAESPAEAQQLIDSFNFNNTKKNIYRINKLNDLLDTINQEAVNRFEKRPAEISNKEVLDYMNAVQNQIDRSQKTVASLNNISAVQVNNTQNNTVNIKVGDTEVDNLTKASRDKITSLVAEILKQTALKTENDIVLDVCSEPTTTSESIESSDAELHNN